MQRVRHKSVHKAEMPRRALVYYAIRPKVGDSPCRGLLGSYIYAYYYLINSLVLLYEKTFTAAKVKKCRASGKRGEIFINKIEKRWRPTTMYRRRRLKAKISAGHVPAAYAIKSPPSYLILYGGHRPLFNHFRFQLGSQSTMISLFPTPSCWTID
ncbi:hypothetical protein DAPPUDRAFT_238392 [Daphnia pulex]|uniref:Uncharacterized protein n=1 Tax=Daphnia pulex TaxID=6669 RepID=E9G6A0_DAPPU|nr:hypothetical protein DAPPUDRAFT_238392 [Daphnia pulex]|eukprot:EFX84897.1 hypothetical protein DAPPUDRAFT_238392 [Daphnia pulex]